MFIYLKKEIFQVLLVQNSKEDWLSIIFPKEEVD